MRDLENKLFFPCIEWSDTCCACKHCPKWKNKDWKRPLVSVRPAVTLDGVVCVQVSFTNLTCNYINIEPTGLFKTKSLIWTANFALSPAGQNMFSRRTIPLRQTRWFDSLAYLTPSLSLLMTWLRLKRLLLMEQPSRIRSREFSEAFSEPAKSTKFCKAV